MVNATDGSRLNLDQTRRRQKSKAIKSRWRWGLVFCFAERRSGGRNHEFTLGSKWYHNDSVTVSRLQQEVLVCVILISQARTRLWPSAPWGGQPAAAVGHDLFDFIGLSWEFNNLLRFKGGCNDGRWSFRVRNWQNFRSDGEKRVGATLRP